MKADLSSIFSGFIVFITFLISLVLLNYFIDVNYQRNLNFFDKKVNYYYNKILELIDFVNNETNLNNEYIIIKNVGKIPLDVKCFKLYLDNLPVNFSYRMIEYYSNNLLDPGEYANLSFFFNKTGWVKVSLVSCRGNRFVTLLYIR